MGQPKDKVKIKHPHGRNNSKNPVPQKFVAVGVAKADEMTGVEGVLTGPGIATSITACSISWQPTSHKGDGGGWTHDWMILFTLSGKEQQGDGFQLEVFGLKGGVRLDKVHDMVRGFSVGPRSRFGSLTIGYPPDNYQVTGDELGYLPAYGESDTEISSATIDVKPSDHNEPLQGGVWCSVFTRHSELSTGCYIMTVVNQDQLNPATISLIIERT